MSRTRDMSNGKSPGESRTRTETSRPRASCSYSEAVAYVAQESSFVQDDWALEDAMDLDDYEFTMRLEAGFSDIRDLYRVDNEQFIKDVREAVRLEIEKS